MKTMTDREWKLLMIDDDEQSVASLCAAARLQGWMFLSAKDILAGLELFRVEKPDLVLVEYGLPGLDGVRGVEMLRELDGQVPIVAVAAEEHQNAANRSFEAGADDFAVKPLKAPDIVSRIRLHFRLLECGGYAKAWETAPVSAPKAKGIGAATLELIRGAFRTNAECLTVETIAERTGLAYQTTYRYLQHLTAQELVEVSQNYGKVGRPKQKYRLRARNGAD